MGKCYLIVAFGFQPGVARQPTLIKIADVAVYSFTQTRTRWSGRTPLYRHVDQIISFITYIIYYAFSEIDKKNKKKKLLAFVIAFW